MLVSMRQKLEELTQRVAAQPRLVVAMEAIVLVAFLGIADFATGSELSFSIFYLIPITLVAWLMGLRPALAVGALASAIWLLADYAAGHVYLHPLVPYWNAGIRLGYFVLFAVLFSRLRDQLDKERILSSRDSLTGAYNRRAFEELASREVARAARYDRPLALAFVDLDHFKSVNDRFGHEVGDTVLREVADVFMSTFRNSDIVARLGGDEFAIVMPETAEDDARVAIEKSRVALGKRMDEHGWPVTISVGLAATTGKGGSLAELLASADRLMYLAKRAGRGRVVVGRPDEPADQPND